MPPRYYFRPQPPPLPHLSNIIKLEPVEEPWCAGFAHSQGRRCHNRTNARSRKAAASLLDEGTRDLHQGFSIDDVLENLAPLVLCKQTKSHRSQAPELVRTWQRRVQRFKNSYNTPAPVASQTSRTTTSTSTSTSTSASPSARRTSSGQQELGPEHLERRLHDISVELERLTATVSATESRFQNLSSRLYEQAGAPSGSVRPAGGVDANTASDGSVSSRDTSSTRPSRTTVSSPVAISSRSISPASTSLTSPLDAVPRHARTTAQITLPSSRAGDATRRPIEGECGICLNPLPRTRSRNGSSSGDEVEDADTEEDTDSDYEEESEEEGEEESDEESEEETGEESEEEIEEIEDYEGLTWCKAQCGVNYHAECIEQWLRESRHRNCPTCRSGWIE